MERDVELLLIDKCLVAEILAAATSPYGAQDLGKLIPRIKATFDQTTVLKITKRHESLEHIFARWQHDLNNPPTKEQAEDFVRREKEFVALRNQFNKTSL